MHVAVVDDEVRLVDLVTSYLQELGFTTTSCYNGADGLEAAHDVTVDAMVLDLMMPGLSGLEVCRIVRREGLGLPILMLTARGAVRERVAGLEAGADDYLVKPFAMEELAARLKALTRRLDPLQEQLTVGAVRLDSAAQRVWIGGEEVAVPRREFALLRELMLNAGRLVTRQQLFEAVWDEDDADIASNALEVHVYRLRNQLTQAGGVEITTLRNRGYRLEETRSTPRSQK